MKKSTIIILTILFLILFIGSCLFYSKVYKPAHEKQETSTMYYAQNMGRSKSGKRVLLAELPEQDFQLYQDGDYIILAHGGQESEFDNWSRRIGDEEPQMYYLDFDGDGTQELIIRALEGIDKDTEQKQYVIYVLFVHTDENGQYSYDIMSANSETWNSLFNDALKCETTQPVLNKKRIQYVMQGTTLNINYDPITGISSGTRAWYIKSLSDGKNNYYTLQSWYLSTPYIDVDTENNRISVRVNYYITYNETDEVQYGGIINGAIDIQNGDFDIAKQSVTFTTAEQYRVTTLQSMADKDWTYTFNNDDKTLPSARTIKSTAFKCRVQSETNEHTIFSGTNDETKAIERIVVTKNTMKLYAKSGCSFSPDPINALNYSVTVQVGGVNSDITLSGSVDNENGVSVLTFVLDKDYPQDELTSFTVNIGQ